MKILKITLEGSNVNCPCVFSLQGTDHIMDVNFSENELYHVASQRGKDTWENEDVVAVVSQIAGMPCTF